MLYIFVRYSDENIVNNQKNTIMTYNFTYQILDASNINLIRQDEEGKEIELKVTMKDFFECAQFLGLFPGGTDFDDEFCIVQFEKTHGSTNRKTRVYTDLLNGLAFGDDDIQKIGARLFEDELPETLYLFDPTCTMVKELKFKGFFNGPLFSKDLIEYVGGDLIRLVFKDEINKTSFFTSEIEAKKRLRSSLRITLGLLDDEIDNKIAVV